MVTSSLGLLGCLSPGPQVVPPPEFTTASARVFSQPSQTPAAPVAQALVTPTAAPPTAAPATAKWEPSKPARAWKYIVMHHSATTGGDVTSIDAEHQQREDAQGNPWLGIGYHFVVGNGRGMADGAVEPTFRWRDQLHGAHAGQREYNDAGIGICLIGDFEQNPPTTRQIAAVRELLAELMARYQLQANDFVLHRDVAATKCPGRHFQLDQFLVRSAPSEPRASAPTVRIAARCPALLSQPPRTTPSP